MFRFQAITLLIITGLLWSVIGVLTKWNSWHPISIAGGLSFFAALTQISVVRRLPRIKADTTAIGALFYCLNTLLFIGAIQLSSVANAVFLQFTAPIYVAIIGGITIGEKSNVCDWISLILILLGTGLFFYGKMTPVELSGTLLAMISGISVAGYTLCLRKQKDNEPIDLVILGSIGVFLISIPWLIKEDFSFTNVGLVAVLGSICYGVSFLIYVSAIKQVRAIEALLISTFEIVLGPVWAFLFLNEFPNDFAMYGGIIILLVVVIYSYLTIIENSTANKPINKISAIVD